MHFRTVNFPLLQKLSHLPHPPMLCPAVIYSHPPIPHQSSPLCLCMSSALAQLSSSPFNSLHVRLAYVWMSHLTLHSVQPVLPLPSVTTTFLPGHNATPACQPNCHPSFSTRCQFLCKVPGKKLRYWSIAHQEMRKRMGYIKHTDSTALTWNKNSLKE